MRYLSLAPTDLDASHANGRFRQVHMKIHYDRAAADVTYCLNHFES